MLSILLRIFGDAQHLCSANGTHIAGLIWEVPAKISSELPRHGRLGSPWNIPTDIGCVLGPDLAAKTSEHLFRGFQKLPGVFPLVYCTMNYTVVGSQIPDLSKETHKKTSMTVHLSLKCECSVGKTTPCKHESPVAQQGWVRVGGAWERVGRGWERVGRGWERVGRGWERVGRGWETVGRGWERVGRGLGERGRGLGEGGRGLGEGGGRLREGGRGLGEGWERVVEG